MGIAKNERVDRAPLPWKVSTPNTAREMTQFKNKVPFDENTYRLIRETISMLTKRLTSNEHGEFRAFVSTVSFIEGMTFNNFNFSIRV